MNTQAIINNQSENTNNMEMTNDQLMSKYFEIVEKIKEMGLSIPNVSNGHVRVKPTNTITTTITKKMQMLLAINNFTGEEIGKFPFTKKSLESLDLNIEEIKRICSIKGTAVKGIRVGNSIKLATLSIIEVEQNDVPKVKITSSNKSGGGKDKPCKMIDKTTGEISYWDSVRSLVNTHFKGGDASYHNKNARDNEGIDIESNDANLIYGRYALCYI